ncbi:MAG: YceI family protein [Sulfurospirillaceae bacterium]|nr:YceI family protein [Sulfurospirillaceae bacterium]MDD2826088.1 YceI family protein [Sulfurospirillaceae bacterium]
MKFSTISLAALLATGALHAGVYNIDSTHSNVGFKVKHVMISNVVGKFDTFNGVIEYDEATKTLKNLTGTIETNSVNTANSQRDTHLKSADLFDVAKYATITFALQKADKEYAYGKLTIHGVTKDVKLAFTDNGIATDPYGNQRVGLELKGTINRKDFGITWNKILETGGLTVGEDVKLDVELEGILKK